MSTCHVCSNRAATHRCSSCGRLICEDCAVGQQCTLCQQALQQPITQPPPPSQTTPHVRQVDPFLPEGPLPPRSVSAAVMCLYVALIAGMPYMALTWSNTWNEARGEAAVGVGIFFGACLIVAMAVVAGKIGRGHNWARLTFLITFGCLGPVLIGAGVLLALLGDERVFSPWSIVSVVQLGLQVSAFVLLVKPESRRWFDEMRQYM